MSKAEPTSPKSKPKQDNTATMLESAQIARAKAAQALDAAAQAFTNDPSPEKYSREIAAQNDLGYCDRIVALAIAACDKADADRLAADAARVEAERVAALKIVTDRITRNEAEAIAAGAELARCYAAAKSLAGESQMLGGTNYTLYYALTSALADALIAHDVYPGAISVAF